LIAFHPDLGQYLGYVDGEFVRGGIHAGVVASATVMAQMSHENNVSVHKVPLQFDRLKNRAISFAITASIANRELPACLFNEFTGEHV
jgi:hypothetical protein